jgi:hypothetical protein
MSQGRTWNFLPTVTHSMAWNPSSTAFQTEKAPQPQALKSLLMCNSAKNRGKMEPIILILNGWEMAFAFQHEMCLKISCEF